LKHLKNLTAEQKKLFGKDKCKDWYLERDTAEVAVFVNAVTGAKKTWQKNSHN
jgi:hypothetical protein